MHIFEIKKRKKCGSTFGRIVDNVQTKMPQQGDCGGGEEEHQPLRHKKRRVVNVLFSDRKVQCPRQTGKEIKRDPGYVTDGLMFCTLRNQCFTDQLRRPFYIFPILYIYHVFACSLWKKFCVIIVNILAIVDQRVNV